MREIPSTPDFSNRPAVAVIISQMDAGTDVDMAAVASLRRPRSHSYYSPEDAKHYGESTENVDIQIRPRSRSFYSYETSENYNEASFTRANAVTPQDVCLLLSEGSRKSMDAVMMKLLCKRSKASINKISTSKEISGMVNFSLFYSKHERLLLNLMDFLQLASVHNCLKVNVGTISNILQCFRCYLT